MKLKDITVIVIQAQEKCSTFWVPLVHYQFAIEGKGFV